MTPQPLRGKTVVELSQFIAGPTAAQMLSDFGATILKIEPSKGDGTRALPGSRYGSVFFRCFNTGKTSQVIDLGSPEGQEELARLLASADALVCNAAPRALDKLKLDPASVKERFPHLVVTLVSGFGQQDDRACMDTIAQCESGFAWLNGNEDGTPRVSTSWPVDFYSGHYAAMSTAMALLDPARKGGMIIDLSMMEVAASMLLGPAALMVAEGGELAAPSGNSDRASSPSGIYPCRDGHVYIFAGLDQYWQALRSECDGPAASFTERMEQMSRFNSYVADWTRQRSKTEVMAVMARLRIPAGVVRHPDDALSMIMSLRPDSVLRAEPDGQQVPVYPALFDGQRIQREVAPAFPNTPR
ncbi:CoA transferase [Vreelandella glaciei]|uniref:CaiB/BaiF CoA transferase family protein n=1 Tax=Vreelandella glaciei TaxID=186761 RepID=UPI0030026DB6